MTQGFGLNYSPNFFMLRDSGPDPPGMDCLQLQLQPHQLRTQPFHYLINEQAKSLLALQELQNEVGALLEFRDLVMDTFPNLRHKMSSLTSRQWEPGIKVKRKIVNKADQESAFGRARSNSHGSKIQSSQPKSSDGISGVQDSGFSTETNSSNKDHASSTATSVALPAKDPEFEESVAKANEAEEELWNLLDVIHTKGTKLREEVETLQLRLVVEEIENHLREKESKIREVEKKYQRRCRSLENMSLTQPVVVQEAFHDCSFEEGVFNKKRTRSIELEDIDDIRAERNMLLDKLTEMETERVASRVKTSELQGEMDALRTTKEQLEEQLVQAMKQKMELNSRIHELHLKFVSGDRRRKKTGETDVESSRSEKGEKNQRPLGALDGVVSQPKRVKELWKVARPSSRKLEAILKEKNYLELQRHLLVSVVENQALNIQLETSIRSQDDLFEQLDKYKEENDELKFQLEERTIELEGTRAHVRVLERLQQPRQQQQQTESNFTFLENDHLRSKGFSETEISRARQIFLDSQNKKVDKSEVCKVLSRAADLGGGNFELGRGSNVIPILALPMPVMASHQSSGTESSHALEISSELEADLTKTDKSPYKRRPSKIPLNIQKTTVKPTTTTVTMTLKKAEPTLTKTNPASTRGQDSKTSTRVQPARRPSTQRSLGDDSSLTSGKNLSLKQTTNFSTIRQRDTLTRRNQDGADSGKRTIRGTLRDSFRSRTSADSSIGSRKDQSLSSMKRDSMQQKQTRNISPANKSILASDEMTKVAAKTTSPKHLRIATLKKLEFSPFTSTEDLGKPEGKSDSDNFSDSLDSPRKVEHGSSLYRQVRDNFQKRIADKMLQLTCSDTNVWKRPVLEAVGLPMFDSIDASYDVDKDDSLIINSSSYVPAHSSESVLHEAMADANSISDTPIHSHVV